MSTDETFEPPQRSEQQYVLCADRIATMVGGGRPYGLLERGAIAVRSGRIEWIGDADRLPSEYRDWSRSSARLLTPTLIDCHTHLVFGGNRADEFEQRLLGRSYEEIAGAGGGILSTMRATRQASEEELLELAVPRARHLLAEGVATIEVKSGYGLDIDSELKMLRVARRLSEAVAGLRTSTTLLAAHAVPPEYRERTDAYVDLVCEEILPRAVEEGLVDQVDVFCESIAFDLAQSRRVLEAAAEAGLSRRVHAEQLSASGAARLAAEMGALSADHLECATAEDARAMAASGTVAVLLPGAFYTLRETRVPPVNHFRDAGVAMAVATDWNPGSSPLGSLLLAMNMGCTLFGLTPEEALAGVTRSAARVLGLEADLGTLEVGRRAEFLEWPYREPAELCYRIAGHELPRRWGAGRVAAEVAAGATG